MFIYSICQSGILGAADLSLVSGKTEPEFIFYLQTKHHI